MPDNNNSTRFDIKKFMELNEKNKMKYIQKRMDKMDSWEYECLFRNYTPSLNFLQLVEPYVGLHYHSTLYSINRILSANPYLSIECLLTYKDTLHWLQISKYNKKINKLFIEAYYHLFDLEVILSRKDLRLSQKLRDKLTEIMNFQKLLLMDRNGKKWF